MPAKAPTWAPPRPLRPATPTRMVSLAPSTRPDDFVPAMVMVAAVARALLRNVRRLWRVMAGPFGKLSRLDASAIAVGDRPGRSSLTGLRESTGDRTTRRPALPL